MSTPKEKPLEEPKLSVLERAECASELINEFKKVIGNSSRFQEMLSRTYFSVIPGEVKGLVDNPIPFQSGDNLYNAFYMVSDDNKKFKQVLKIQKSPVGEENKGDLKQVTLMTGAEEMGKQPTWGTVAYTRYPLSETVSSPQEYHFNTNTAVEKVAEVLADVTRSVFADFDKKVEQEEQIGREMEEYDERLLPYYHRFIVHKAIVHDPTSPSHSDRMKEIGNRCRVIRRKMCKLSREEVAKEMGIDPVQLEAFEGGLIPPPGICQQSIYTPPPFGSFLPIRILLFLEKISAETICR